MANKAPYRTKRRKERIEKIVALLKANPKRDKRQLMLDLSNEWGAMLRTVREYFLVAESKL